MVDIEHTCHSGFFAAMRETYVYYFMRQRKYILKASESTYICTSLNYKQMYYLMYYVNLLIVI